MTTKEFIKSVGVVEMMNITNGLSDLVACDLQYNCKEFKRLESRKYLTQAECDVLVTNFIYWLRQLYDDVKVLYDIEYYMLDDIHDNVEYKKNLLDRVIKTFIDIDTLTDYHKWFNLSEVEDIKNMRYVYNDIDHAYFLVIKKRRN